MSQRVARYITIHWAVAVGMFGVFTSGLFGYGVARLLDTPANAATPPPLGVAAAVVGLLGFALYCIWVIIFFKRYEERLPPDGAEPVELFEE